MKHLEGLMVQVKNVRRSWTLPCPTSTLVVEMFGRSGRRMNVFFSDLGGLQESATVYLWEPIVWVTSESTPVPPLQLQVPPPCSI